MFRRLAFLAKPALPVFSQASPSSPARAEERDSSGAPPAPTGAPTSPVARHANDIADANGVFDSMFGYGPATFGNSYGAADSGPAASRGSDPYAWAQRLRDIPDGACVCLRGVWAVWAAPCPAHLRFAVIGVALPGTLQLPWHDASHSCTALRPQALPHHAPNTPNPLFAGFPLVCAAEDVLAELSLMGYTGDTGSVGRRGGGASGCNLGWLVLAVVNRHKRAWASALLL